MSKLTRIYRKQKGVTAIEYALLAAALATLLIAVAGNDSDLNKAVTSKFKAIAEDIEGSSSAN
ncbi:MAG: Flp family type IVb pilin [Marinobacterium sp.]|nr:Flp family type IVb pilin [Marinobacterium sp.]